MENNNSLMPLSQAVEAIKTAILQGQYEAAKDVNRVQLAVYFAVGKYLSRNTRKGVWGTGALKKISEQLRKELPGLRGYSETNLKNMRSFYDNWQLLDSYSSVATDEFVAAIPTTEIIENDNSSVVTDKLALAKSSVATDDLQISNNQIDIYHTLVIPNIAEFPIEDFFKVPFTHHVEIFTKVENLAARYYYIHRTAEKHLSVESLENSSSKKRMRTKRRFPTTLMRPCPIPLSHAKP
jgi:hypothetical protein